MDIFDKKAYFLANWLHIIHIPIKGVKPTTLGNFSVFSVLCHYCSYLSWEASQQNFLWKFLLTITSPTFKTIIIFHVKPFFTPAHGPTVKMVNKRDRCGEGIQWKNGPRGLWMTSYEKINSIVQIIMRSRKVKVWHKHFKDTRTLLYLKLKTLMLIYQKTFFLEIPYRIKIPFLEKLLKMKFLKIFPCFSRHLSFATK